MRLRRLELENCRGFERLELDFHERLTVLVGENGSGKSSILDALQGSFELRRGSTEGSAKWFFEREGKPHSGQINVQLLPNGVRHDNNAKLCPGQFPELVPFSSTRSSEALTSASRPPDPSTATQERDGSRPSFSVFLSWFYDRENYENQEKARGGDYKDIVLEAVRQAIAALLPEVEDPRFDRVRPGERDYPALVVTKAGTKLSVTQLSDGERSLLALVANIARRAAAVSPADPLNAPMVVLIDELDTHLHPRWQVAVIPRLLDTFPKTQFVVTTHSPLVLMNVASESVRVLREFRLVPLETETRGRDARDLLIDIFRAATRPANMQARLDALAASIDEEKLTVARDELAELSAELGDDDGELTRLSSLLDFLED